MGAARLRGPRPLRASEKGHFAQGKHNMMPGQPGEAPRALGMMLQAEMLELGTATDASGEKKGGAASARQGGRGQS